MSQAAALVRGLTGSFTHAVGPDDTAKALESGSLDVLATPRLVAWCEQATCAAIAEQLDAKSTSVGTRVRVDHLAASAVGATVTVQATLVSVDGRLLQFEVVALDTNGQAVAQGEVRRVVVDIERFLERVPAPG